MKWRYLCVAHFSIGFKIICKGTLEPDVISFDGGVIFSLSAPTKCLVQWDGMFPTITMSDDIVIDKGSQRTKETKT